MVRMLPKRNEGRSVAKPGVRKLHSMPMLIPSVQNMAIAESSRTLPRRDIHCMPKAESTENAIADATGLNPI